SASGWGDRHRPPSSTVARCCADAARSSRCRSHSSEKRGAAPLRRVRPRSNTSSRRRQMVDRDAVDRNPQKDPSDWVTGDQPATGPQESYLSTLAQEAGEEVDPTTLTKA